MSTYHPYRDSLIPVCSSLDEFYAFQSKYSQFFFCPYIADKTGGQWKQSTSRQYMNQLLDGFLYVPVNIPRGDTSQLQSVVEHADSSPSIAAINITAPHKNSPVLLSHYHSPAVDTVLRHVEPPHPLEAHSLNVPAFLCWYTQNVETFADAEVVLWGLGGVGEPLARALCGFPLSRLVLVDPYRNVKTIAESLPSRSFPVECHSRVVNVNSFPFGRNTVCINATGKDNPVDDNEESSESSPIVKYVEKFGEYAAGSGGVFVDLRPHLHVPLVSHAASSGWGRTYTGHGMNIANDYILLEGICRYMNVATPEYETFVAAVREAS